MTEQKRVEELEAEKKVLLDIIDNLQNRTELHWRYKPENIAIDLQKSVPFVKHVKDYASSLNDDSSVKLPAHCLIKGDNLATVMALQATHKEAVDVIYIDPPYNTGNKDFIYNDSFMDKDNPYRHANWLSFMESRLRLARELLTDTGVIMVAIGQDEDARLRLLLDQIFDEKNYIGEVYWYGGNKNDHRFLSVGTDSMFIYAKSKKALNSHNVKFRTIKPGLDVMLSKAKELWDKYQDPQKATVEYRAWFAKLPARHPAKQLKANAGYNSIDDKGRLYSTSDMSWPGHGGPKYDVLHPVTNLPVAIPVRGWRVIEKTMEKYLAEGILKFGKTHKNSLSKKIFLENTSGIIMNNIISVPRSRANKVVAGMIGKNKFNYPKDHNVLAEWIDYVTPQFRKDESHDKPVVVLDFFAGSGSTGHAVLELNAKDNVNRQFILATNNEGGIADDVTLPRLLAAMTGQWEDKKKHKALGGSLREFKIIDDPEGMINPETFLNDEQSLCADDSSMLEGSAIASCEDLIEAWKQSIDFLTPRHWVDVDKYRQ